MDEEKLREFLKLFTFIGPGIEDKMIRIGKHEGLIGGCEECDCYNECDRLISQLIFDQATKDYKIDYCSLFERKS